MAPTPSQVALLLLVPAIAAGLWAGLSDLRRMKIPNNAVLLLLAGFVVIGFGATVTGDWGLDVFAVRMLQGLALLVLGFLINMIGGMGAGDAKFLAASAPYIAMADLVPAMAILAASTLVAFGLHRVARATVGPRLAPDWLSWSTGRRFPMGVSFGLALVVYLILVATR